MNWKNFVSFWRKTNNTHPVPEYYRHYQKNYSKPNWSGHITDQRFLVLDTESGGLDPKKSSLLSIGAVTVIQMGFHTDEAIVLHLPNNAPQNQEEVAIHGLVQDGSKTMSISTALEQLLPHLYDSILVGHNILFDVALINRYLKMEGAGPLLNPSLDTAYLARRLDNPVDPGSLHSCDYTLDALCKRFGIETFGRHTAEGDAYITALIFIMLTQRLIEKGITTTGQLR